MTITRQILIIVSLILLTAACRQQQLSSSDTVLDLAVTDMLVGETTLLVSVRDQAGETIANPGTLSVRGDMDHAGMTPIFGNAQTAVDGVFTVPFQWTMAGGWIVEASLQLESGDLVTQTFHLEVLSEAGEDDMDSGMDHAGMSGETSAAYLQIENRGSVDVTITSARTAAATAAEFHQTIVEDDIARMEPLPTLTIPAGQMLHLRPGGIHIMLLDLKENLVVGSSIVLELILDSYEVIALNLPIMQMQMDDDATEIAVGDLVFSRMWARPASAGDMSEMDHEDKQMDSDTSE